MRRNDVKRSEGAGLKKNIAHFYGALKVMLEKLFADERMLNNYSVTFNLMVSVLSDEVPTMMVKSPGSTTHFMSLS